MIYIIVILFAIFAPFLGVVGMELGAFSLTASEYGYRVGATEAYLMYVVIISLTIYALNYKKMVFPVGFNFGLPASMNVSTKKREVVRIELLLLVVLGAALAYHNLILAGGWRVVEGLTGRGEFRAGLGQHGVVAYLIIKWYAPVILAYACIVCFKSDDVVAYILTLLIFILSAMSSVAFGYKASIVLLVTPALIILFWKPRLLTLVLFPSLGLALIIGGYLVFGVDKVGSAEQGFSSDGLVNQLIYRVFVLQGELPWKVWGEYVKGHDMPPYLETVKSLLGGRIGGLLFGAGPLTPEQIVASNFGMMTTHFAGYPIDGVLAGHNSTATAFSEGVIAGGMAGVVAVSVLSGVVIYFVYQSIDLSLKSKNYIVASVFSVYSIFAVMSWLIGGGISSLAHISVIFGFVTSIFMLATIRFVSLILSSRLQTKN